MADILLFATIAILSLTFAVSVIVVVWKQVYGPMTNADRIRIMTDEELAVEMVQNSHLDDRINYCQDKPECEAYLEADRDIPDEWCKNCLLEWLRKPAE